LLQKLYHEAVDTKAETTMTMQQAVKQGLLCNSLLYGMLYNKSGTIYCKWG